MDPVRPSLSYDLCGNIDSSLGPNMKVYLSNQIWTREREKAVDLEDDKSRWSENKFPSSKIHTELNSIFCGYIRLYTFRYSYSTYVSL